MSAQDDQELQGRVLTQLGAQAGRPFGIRRLLELLRLPAHESRRLRRLLKNLVNRGKVVSEGRGRYSLADQVEELSGVLGRSRRAYVPLVDSGGACILHISYDSLGGALPGDRVLAEVSRRRPRPPHHGRVIGIQTRGVRPIVGIYRRQAKACTLIPDDERLGEPILVIDETAAKPRDGQVVAVVIVDEKNHARPRARVVRVLGEPGEFATELERLILDHQLERDFPEQVQAELEAGVCDGYQENRADLRLLPLVTIDPPDAKDFDDAVYVEENEGGFRLWVAIADVAAFVPPDGPIDLEATRRGCSTYLPGTVFPMLPPALSEEECSLAPGRDRAAMVLRLDLDAKGLLTGGRAQRALIRSSARLSYQEVQAVLDGESPSSRAGARVEDLQRMAACARLLLTGMKDRGQILFDMPESRFELDEEGWPIHVSPSPAGLANRMVEAFMVAANEAVARLLKSAEAPALYRVHPTPDPTRVEVFVSTASGLGCPPPFAAKPSPGQVSKFLESIRAKPIGPAIEHLMLRTLMQARYAVECQEHFGLASDCYLHFTSPIRRYPDLMVHRQLGRLLDSGGTDGIAIHGAHPAVTDWPVDASHAQDLAERCSKTERKAVAAEREAADLFQAAWASKRIGEVFTGRVGFVTDFGLFVRLEPSGVEGLVHVTRLNGDRFDYDPGQLALVGCRSGQTFRVGMSLQVKLVSANLSARQVDLALAEEATRPRRRP